MELGVSRTVIFTPHYSFHFLFTHKCIGSVQSLGLLVPLSSMPLDTYTCGLSMSSSRTALTSFSRVGSLFLGPVSRLDAFSGYRLYVLATQLLPLAWQLIHQWHTHSGPLVLGATPFKLPAPAADRDRTVLRRSEPSSRTALMGEQPNPWDLIQPQDAMSRHRGAEPGRRCELLDLTSLLSPG